MPTFALVTPGDTTLGPFDLDEDEMHDGAITRRDGEPDRRVVGFIERTAPENFDVLLIERVQVPKEGDPVAAPRGRPTSGSARRRRRFGRVSSRLAR